MYQIKLSDIRTISYSALIRSGVPSDEANIIVDSIIFAHEKGKGTHGITRLPIYLKKIKNGLMSAETPMTLIKDAPVVTIADAANGFGQVAGYRAMEMCISKAKKFGIGVVGVRNSNNFGTAGFISELATRNNMIGVVFANSAPAIAPWGGKKPLFGTNPIGFAFPNREDRAVISLDMATSFAARGKIRLAAKNGEKIPFGWALDINGNPTDDPMEALKGSMIPIGEHKGYGLSLAVDLLAGLLTGAAFAGDVKPLNNDDGYSNYGHLIIAINISFFMDYNEYLEKMDIMEKRVKETGENGAVLMPGERSWNFSKEVGDTVKISLKQLEEIKGLIADLDLKIDLNSPLG
ncbi:MAG: Ldh family oxidoreductase [Flavobacterium sp.]|nr:MAG: Ldh family oxidoreductase [Flavobacterium sp.]